MTRSRSNFRLALSALAAAALLTACGGGEDANTTPKLAIKAVHVFGDSLADVGTFGGLRFTVNGTGAVTYPERVAALYGVSGLCAYYTPTSATTQTSFAAKPGAEACTGYAIGGARINPLAQNAETPGTRLSVAQQLADAAARTTYSASDLLVIDGGGNDAADLIGAFLAAQQGSTGAFTALLGSAGIAFSAPEAATQGGQYMVKLAQSFHQAIDIHVLSRARPNNAQNVVILNIPDVTLTPRFQAVLAQVASGPGGATGAAQVQALSRQWISAFNSTLAALVQGDRRVVLVDFYTAFGQQVAAPAQFGLQNATTPVCPSGFVDGTGTPICTADILSAQTPPTGATGGANWWKSFGFADGFHPTPYAHQLLSQQISLDLAKSGRL